MNHVRLAGVARQNVVAGKAGFKKGFGPEGPGEKFPCRPRRGRNDGRVSGIVDFQVPRLFGGHVDRRCDFGKTDFFQRNAVPQLQRLFAPQIFLSQPRDVREVVQNNHGRAARQFCGRLRRKRGRQSQGVERFHIPRRGGKKMCVKRIVARHRRQKAVFDVHQAAHMSRKKDERSGTVRSVRHCGEFLCPLTSSVTAISVSIHNRRHLSTVSAVADRSRAACPSRRGEEMSSCPMLKPKRAFLQLSPQRRETATSSRSYFWHVSHHTVVRPATLPVDNARPQFRQGCPARP